MLWEKTAWYTIAPLCCAILIAGPGCSSTTSATADGPAIERDTSIAPDSSSDAGRPDAKQTVSCLAECLAIGERLCVKLPQDGHCVECLSDADCRGNPAALGSRCDQQLNLCHCAGHPGGPVCDDDGLCTCSADSDCTASENGSRCVSFPGFSRCGCDDATHCSGSESGPGCFEQYHLCECSSNLDCAGNNVKTTCQAPYSHSKYKQCEEPCQSDSDCLKTEMHACDTNTGACVGCTDNSHCTGNRRGLLCTGDQTCGCSTEADCPYATDICTQDLLGAIVCVSQ